MLRYLNVREELFSDEFGNYISYGISILRKANNKWIEEKFLSDVSLDTNIVSKICNVAFSNQIEPKKIMDFIEIFI